MNIQLLREWKLSQGRRAPRTVEERVRVVTLFARRQDVDPVGADWQAVARFLNDPRFSAGTVAAYHAVLCAWFGWLVREGHRVDNPMSHLDRPRSVRRYPRPVSTDELARILARVNRRRTRAMVLLAAYAGLRACEISRVRGQDFRGGELVVVGKGGHLAGVPVHALIVEQRELFPRIGWWFASYGDPSQPVTAKHVSSVIGDAISRAGVDATGHQLRHWFGTYSLKAAGGNLRVAQDLLRHSSIASTAIYTKVDDEQLRAAVAALPVPLRAV